MLVNKDILCNNLFPGYKAVDQQTRRDFYVFQDDQNICTSGNARYKLGLSQGNHYKLSDEFAAAACKLPLTYDQAVYKQFLDTWGTVSYLQKKICLHLICQIPYPFHFTCCTAFTFTRLYCKTINNVSLYLSPAG